jgi:BMFP domain-containing protein YqiC
MSQTAASPLEALISRLRDSLGDRAPEERIRPVLDGFFERFQLVPRHEYDTHLADLAKLEDTVSRLEERIAELERSR